MILCEEPNERLRDYMPICCVGPSWLKRQQKNKKSKTPTQRNMKKVIKPKMIEKPDDLTEEECQEAFAMFREHRAKSNKRKNSSETVAPSKKRRRTQSTAEAENDSKIKQVINLGIPHVGEQIFESLGTNDLIQCLSVSKDWRVLAENVLFQRWQGELFEACEDGIPEVVRILLNRTDNLESQLTVQKVRESVEYTAFMIACALGHKEVVKVFLEYPRSKYIDLNAKTSIGHTAFILACGTGQSDVVELLLEHQSSKKIDLNCVDEFEQTGFMCACELGYKDVVKLILDHPASKDIDFNHTDNFGSTIFLAACRNGYADVLKLILAHPNSKNIDFNYFGQTTFMAVCKEGRKEIVKLLMDIKEINVDAEDYIGKTALQYAQERNDEAMIKILQRKIKH